MVLFGGNSNDVVGDGSDHLAGGSSSLVERLAHWAEQAGSDIAFTFVDYAGDRSGVAHSLTWSEIDRRVRATAARLQQHAAPGERAAVLAPQGLDYVVAFLGAIRAGLVAVPLFGPGLPGHTGRLEAVLADCAPACVLTTAAAAESVRPFLDKCGLDEHGRPPHRPKNVVAVDAVPDALAEQCAPVDLAPEDVAYLQYTSGSTRTPAGVVISHGNVMSNAAQLIAGYDLDRQRSQSVIWLPLYHDMGLMVGVIGPLVAGMRSVITDPLAFIQRPVRWLRLLSEHPGAFTAAPNFAFDYCVTRVRDRDKAELRLEQVDSLCNGSEPVRPATVERFAEAFAGCGFPPQAHRPSYGLAEATVFVAAAPRRTPVTTAFDRAALARGKAVVRAAADADTSHLVSCGTAVGQHLVIADPETGHRLGEDTVGEIWLHGPNIGRGLWNQPEASEQLFGATLHGEIGELPRAPWLRTGDLGVLHEGELYITGRIKDVIILDGRNHYPQDLEATVEEVHPVIRPGFVAAFAVPTENGEGVVVVSERGRGITRADVPAVTTKVRRALSEQHGVSVRDVLLVGPGEVPRTSSGKVARGECRRRYLEGELTPTEGAA